MIDQSDNENNGNNWTRIVLAIISAITAIIIGYFGVLPLIYENPNLEESTPTVEEPCNINVSEISVSKKVVNTNETIRASIHAQNPEGRAITYNWQAVQGAMEPSIQSPAATATYTAPLAAGGDTISVDINMTGCQPARRSIEISVVINGD